MYEDNGLGSVSVADDINIASGKQYSFEVSTNTSLADILNLVLPDIKLYATNVSAQQSSSGGIFTKAHYVIAFTPSSVMTLGDWRGIFDSAFSNAGGKYSLENIDVGAAAALQKVTPFDPVGNVVNAYAPIAKSIGSGITSFGSWLKYIVIGGAVIVGGVVILTYVPKPSQRAVSQPPQTNPKRTRRAVMRHRRK